MNLDFFTPERLKDACDSLKGIVHHTPLLTSRYLNQLTGCELFFKCENFQKVGAFKFRGASYALSQLSDDALHKGVITHSSGNHAQALALAALERQIPAFIVMPENAPQVKIDAVKGYGAEVTFCTPTLQARESTVEQIQAQTGACFVHPYDNPFIITGQSTCAQEIFHEQPKLDALLVPVGGGGILSGSALAASHFSPQTRVVGCEPEGADDAYQSFQSKSFVPSENPNTLCDGLLTSLGEWTLPLILNHVKDICRVSDPEVIQAMRLIWERMKIIVEPSSAVTLAVIIKHREQFLDQKVGLILTGGNVDLTQLPWRSP